MPSTKVLVAIAKILKDEGYIGEFEVIEKTPQNDLKVTLRYGADKRHTIREIKRVSKPGLRVYAGKDAIPRVKSGLGIAIVSTPQGVLTGLRGATSRNRRRGALHGLLTAAKRAVPRTGGGKSRCHELDCEPITGSRGTSISTISEDNEVSVKGPKGTLCRDRSALICINAPRRRHDHRRAAKR